MKREEKIEQKIDEFLDVWDIASMMQFLEDAAEVFHLFNVDEDKDWVKDAVKEDVNKVRLVRTIYLTSKLADHHAAKLATIRVRFPLLWKKLEEIAKEENPSCEGPEKTT